MKHINEYLLSKSKKLEYPFPADPKEADIIEFLEDHHFEKVETKKLDFDDRESALDVLASQKTNSKRYSVITIEDASGEELHYVSFCNEKSKDNIVFTVQVTKTGEIPVCAYIGWTMDYKMTMGEMLNTYEDFAKAAKTHFGW